MTTPGDDRSRSDTATGPHRDRPAGRHLAYIGLGSNLDSVAGDRAGTLRVAVAVLAELGRIAAVSSLYETEPVGYHDQPAFLNAVVALETSLAAHALLDTLLGIERRFGRDRSRTPAKGPRTLDLDLLLLDGTVLDSPELTLPHPALAERRFVLAPLAEIAPALLHPVLGRTMADLLAALPDEGDNRADAVRCVGQITKQT